LGIEGRICTCESMKRKKREREREKVKVKVRELMWLIRIDILPLLHR